MLTPQILALRFKLSVCSVWITIVVLIICLVNSYWLLSHSQSYFSALILIDSKADSTIRGRQEVHLEKGNASSDLGPLKDNERQDLNCAVKEYLLLAGYRLTAMTFYEEVYTMQDNGFFVLLSYHL